MIDKALLAAALGDRKSFQAVSPAINRKALGDIGRIVIHAAEQYYDRDPAAEKVDLGVLEAQLKVAYPRSEEDLTRFFAELPTGKADPNVVELAREINRRYLGQEMATALAKDDWQRVEKLTSELEALDEEVADEVYTGDQVPSEFFGDNKGTRIPLFPLSLNEKLDGGIFRQSQVLVMARPNVGKSSFCYNLAGALAINGYRVLYLLNEDPYRIGVARLLSRFVEEPFLEIYKEPDKAHAVAVEKGFGNVVMAEVNPGSLEQIRGLVARVKPDVFIVDQLYRIALESKEGATREFATLSSGCRSLAKQFNCVSVVVTQVADAAKDKLFLKQEDVEWSNTGVCGQMDLMIGLAQNEDLEAQHKMMVSFPRWKFGERPKPFSVKVDYPFNKVT